MKLTQLRALLAVHETGSLQAASVRLHISQSALSRAIKELEEDLGVPLLERSIRGATVTSYGEGLLRHVRHALSDLERARQEINAMKDHAALKVSVGLTSSMTFMAPVQETLAEFVADSPRTRLHVHELRPQQMFPMLRDGTLDFVLISQTLQSIPGMEWFPLCRLPLQVMTRYDNPLRNARSLRELREASWLTQDLEDTEYSSLYQLFDVNGLDMPQHVVSCPAVGVLGYLLYNSRLLTLMSEWSLTNPVDPEFPRLMAQVDIIEPIPDSYISLVCLDRMLMTRPAGALFARMREKLLAVLPQA